MKTHTQENTRKEFPLPEPLLSAFRSSMDMVLCLCAGKKDIPLHDSLTVEGQIRTASGMSMEMLSRTTREAFFDYIHRGAGAALAASRYITDRTPRKHVFQKLVSLGYDTVRATSISLSVHVKAFGQWVGSLSSAYASSGKRLRDTKKVLCAAVGAVFLLAAPAPSLASDITGAGNKMGNAELSMEYVNERLASMSSLEKELAAHEILVSDTTARHAAEISLKQKNEPDNKTTVNRLSVERDMATMRLLAAVSEKNAEKRKIHLLRFERDGFDYGVVEDRMRKDSEVMRLFSRAAGLRNIHGEKAIRAVFDTLGMGVPSREKREAAIR